MRTKRILKAFWLSAALLSMGLTASRAMAACPDLFANSFFCVGEVSGGSLAGPVSGGGQTGVCTPNSAGNPCVTSGGVTTLNFADGSSVTASFSGIVGASGGCNIGVGFPANTEQFCNTTPLVAGSTTKVSFATSDDNTQCTGKKAPLKCCTGSGTGTCGGNVCIIGDSDSCPSGQNCLTLSTFSKTDLNACPATDFGCEYASDIASAGQGVYTYSTGAGGASTALTGCTQQVQFSANKALDHFSYVTEGPLGGSCSLAGTTMTLRCQGNIQ